MVDIKIRRGTQSQLDTLKFVEPGFTTDTKIFYIGDGISNVKIGRYTVLELDDTPITYSDNSYMKSTSSGIVFYDIHDDYTKTERVVLKSRIMSHHIYYYDKDDNEEEVIIDERELIIPPEIILQKTLD